MSSLGKPVEHHRPSNLLRLAPGIEEPAPFQVHAHVFHTHVGHSEAISEIPHGQALRALQLIDNLQTLAAANLLDDTLVQGKFRVEVRDELVAAGSNGASCPARPLALNTQVSFSAPK
jgi:hypothetical protein